MKKFIKIMTLLLSLIIIFAFSTACAKPNPPVEGLDDETVEIIREKIYDSFAPHGAEDKLERVIIKKYLGTYNNHVVVYVDIQNGFWLTVVVDHIIDDVYLGTSGDPSQDFWVYTEGEDIIKIDKAYEKGYLTKDNLLSIAEANGVKQSDKPEHGLTAS